LNNREQAATNALALEPLLRELPVAVLQADVA